jgi:hypothetical protein
MSVDLPNIREPFLDARTGQISRAWWIWLQQLMTRIGGSSGSDLTAIRQAIIDLIAATIAQEIEINGQVALPPQSLDELLEFDRSLVGAVPFDYVSEATSSAPVQSVFGRIGAVTAQSGDYTVGQVTNAASVLNALSQFAATTSAQLATVISDETGSGALVFASSPALAGAPTAPTAATNTNTTQIASTAFVEGEIANPPAAGFGSGTARPVAATTISATGAITPSQTNGIVGTTTNNSVNAGGVGEHVAATSGSTGITSATATNITSISLTAGDWDVSGNTYYLAGSGDTITAVLGGVSSMSASLPAVPLYTQFGNISVTAGGAITTIAPEQRFSLSATTTVYLVGFAVHSGGTATTQGFIRARRVR